MRDDSTQARAGRLRVTLADIETLWTRTYDEHRGTRAPVYAPPASKPPLPLAALSARQHATRRLAELVQHVAQARGIPTRLTMVNGAPHLAAWLTEHADWIVEQPDLGWRVYDIEQIAHDVRAVAEPQGIRRATVGPCPHCAGTLVAWIDDHTALPGRIVCDHEGHTWDREHWQLLGRALDPTPELLDATALATWLTRRFLTTVEPATVWQWARRGHITPANADGDGSRPLYDRTTVADWYLEHRSRRAG